MSSRLELGKLQLALAKSDLRLSSHATATLSYPDLSGIGDDSFPYVPLGWEDVRRSWVQRGSGLRLELDLHIDGLPPPEAQLRALGDVICSAELWSQLALEASQISANADASTPTPSSDRISIALSHAHSLDAQRTECIHRICHVLPSADVAPPSKVNVLELNTIKFSMDVSTERYREVLGWLSIDAADKMPRDCSKKSRPSPLKKRKRGTGEQSVKDPLAEPSDWHTSFNVFERRSKVEKRDERKERVLGSKALPKKRTRKTSEKRPSDPKINAVQENNHSTKSTVKTEGIYALLLPEPHLKKDCWTRTDSGYASLLGAQSNVDDADMLLSPPSGGNEGENEMFTPQSFPSQPSLLTSHAGSHELVPQSKTPAHISVYSNSDEILTLPSKNETSSQEATEVDLTFVVGLIDAALRLTIHKTPYRLMSGVELKESDFKQRLHKAVPVLWSPGYLQETSTRAPLVPTISHVLSQSLFSSAKSPSLMVKLKKLLAQTPDGWEDGKESDKPIPEAFSVDASARFDILSASIWRLLQRQLRPRVSQRLSPLTYKYGQAAKYDEDGHESLFAVVEGPYPSENISFDHDEEEEQLQDEDDIFDVSKERTWFESDQELFQEEERQSWVESDYDLFNHEDGRGWSDTGEDLFRVPVAENSSFAVTTELGKLASEGNEVGSHWPREVNLLGELSDLRDESDWPYNDEDIFEENAEEAENHVEEDDLFMGDLVKGFRFTF